MQGPEDKSGRDDPEDAKKDRGLTGRTLGNFLWMFAGGGVEAILKIVVLLVLARLLMPEDFGVVSAALTIVALAEVTGRIGVAPSIVQILDLRRDHIATGQAATLAMGALLGLLFFFLSGWIAMIYQMPDLQPLVQVFSILFFVKGAGMVGEALLQRAMLFRVLAMINLVSYLLGYAAVSITLAVLGFGPWALVLGQITQSFILAGCHLYFSRKDLAIGFRWASFTAMFRFGFGVTLTQIGGYVAQNADYFIVGRWLGAEALGYYSRAYLLLKQSSQLVGRMGDQVLFPTLATIQEDKPRLQRALNRALSLVAMVQVPMTALLVVTAPEIILVLMGPQWGPAIVPFQVLMGVLFFRTAYKFVGAILRAVGKVYIAALWQWGHASAVVLGAYLGQPYDLWGVAVGVSAAVVFCHLSGLFLVNMVIGVGSGESLKRLLAYAAIGVVLSLFLVAGRRVLATFAIADVWVLLILFVSFGIVYLGLFLFRPTLFGAEGQVLMDQVNRKLRRLRGPAAR